MSRVFVCGLGSVSPAGWTVASLHDTLAQKAPLPTQLLARPGRQKPLKMRSVPPPETRPPFLAHPRLRRASPITHYAVSAAMQALESIPLHRKPSLRIGIVVCLQGGCVQYSCRFFEETIQDPATASPVLFPETVYAAPASHLAALLESAPLVSTLAGDASAYAQGLALGSDWLHEGRIDVCLVIGAEEENWILADALWHFGHRAVISAGAGALCLSLNSEWSLGVELELITDVYPFTFRTNRSLAARQMRAKMPAQRPFEILCDGLDGSPRVGAAETNAWIDWSGPRLSPKLVLGEGLMAGAAWQSVAVCDLLAKGRFTAGNVSLVGANQQAVGVRFAGGRTVSELPPPLIAGNLGS
jgi:hypothetical protein